MTINPVRSGIAFGSLVALWHVAWCGLVAIGAAQRLLDIVLRLHFLQIPVTLLPFSAPVAVMLVTATFVVGFALGAAFAALWNWLHRPAGAARRPAAV